MPDLFVQRPSNSSNSSNSSASAGVLVPAQIRRLAQQYDKFLGSDQRDLLCETASILEAEAGPSGSLSVMTTYESSLPDNVNVDTETLVVHDARNAGRYCDNSDKRMPDSSTGKFILNNDCSV